MMYNIVTKDYKTPFPVDFRKTVTVNFSVQEPWESEDFGPERIFKVTISMKASELKAQKITLKEKFDHWDK
jgi:hypothetical protein